MFVSPLLFDCLYYITIINRCQVVFIKFFKKVLDFDLPLPMCRRHRNSTVDATHSLTAAEKERGRSSFPMPSCLSLTCCFQRSDSLRMGVNFPRLSLSRNIFWFPFATLIYYHNTQWLSSGFLKVFYFFNFF